MENKIWQWLVKTWNALTGKISLAVQIASVLSLTLVSVLVVLLVANWLGVSESFFRLLEILLSPTVIICALVLYLWRRHESHIGGFLGRITKLNVGPFRALAQPNKTIDPILSRGKSGDKSEDGASNAAASPDEIQKKAEQGDAEAQFNLGVLYDNGEGVKQNRVKAAEWYRLAAEQEHAKAQCNLGVLYDRGKGVEQNHTEAAKWYRRAADKGNAAAQSNLGLLYDSGKGVEQNHTEAAKWYRRAADKGNAQAQLSLGFLYYYGGEGVAQDHAEAIKWLRLAAEQELARAQFNLGVLYYGGEGVAQDHAEAIKWLRLAAEQGLAQAQFNLGSLYYNAQDHAEAAKWFRLAAEQGLADAQSNLGVLYCNGEGVVQNYSEAYIWLSLASAGNAPNARKARDQIAQKLDADAIKNAQAKATSREEKIRSERKSESQ